MLSTPFHQLNMSDTNNGDLGVLCLSSWIRNATVSGHLGQLLLLFVNYYFLLLLLLVVPSFSSCHIIIEIRFECGNFNEVSLFFLKLLFRKDEGLMHFHRVVQMMVVHKI